MSKSFFRMYKPEKKSIRVDFRKDFYGNVRFTVALPKRTKNNEKQKTYMKKKQFFSICSNRFKMLQIAPNRFRMDLNGSEWIQTTSGSQKIPKNLMKTVEKVKKTSKNREKMVEKLRFFVNFVNFV